MTVSQQDENSIDLGSPSHHAVVRTNWKGHEKRWLLTAFEKKDPSVAGRTMDISSPPAEPESAGGNKHPPPHGGLREEVSSPANKIKPRETKPGGEQTTDDWALLVELGTRLVELPHT